LLKISGGWDIIKLFPERKIHDMIIKQKNPLYCQVDRQEIPVLKKILWCPMIARKMIYDPDQKRRRAKLVTYPKYLIDSEGFFLHGFLPRVEDYLGEVGESLTLIREWDSPHQNIPMIEPMGISLREDQKRIVSQALSGRSGLIKSPTGSGKTVMAASLIHSIQRKTVFLCHTLTLAKQAQTEFKKMGLNSTLYIGTEKTLSDLTIATIQSFSKLDEKELMADWDLIIVDEAHHCSSFETLYGKTLRLIPSIWRYGFTATIPGDATKEHFMTMEGLFGRVLGELSLMEGIEKGILAKPKVKILKAPINSEVKELRKYQEVYEAGVVRNFGRNNMIMKFVREQADQGKTSLILVNKVNHGEILERIGNRVGLRVQFIYGADDITTRENLRDELSKKNIDCVIATTIWKEGVNIPSLDCIINAAGGKSEIAILQTIGRGLRTTEDKTEVLLVDIFDPNHHYLINHFGERFCLYIDNGWI
jgi:superfamily II DNA or RNA helicase